MDKETGSAKNKPAIDFHSPEFNRTDDLTDISADYRFFEPLNGIVTSDMRHQMERLREEGCADVPERDAPRTKKKERKKKTEEVEPACDLSPLTLISEGRTLIIDGDVDRAMKCRDILSCGKLSCTLVLTGKAAKVEPRSFLSRLAFLEADDVSITGAFGGFSATVAANGEENIFPDGFDLVLDLRPVPSFTGKRLPAGYYAPGGKPEDIARVLAEMPEMRGRFKKPHFTSFVKKRCLHGRSRTLDCLRCIDVCPIGAIRTEGGKISVNHYLCQGCSACVLVCPTDAMEQVHPPRAELLSILEKRLSSDDGIPLPATVVFSDGGTESPEELPLGEGAVDAGVMNLAVEEIGHVGMETILFALSHGADRVEVRCDSENPQGIRDAAAWQAYMARAVLKGLGMDEDKCRFVVADAKISPDASATDGLEGEADEADAPDRQLPDLRERRVLIRQAVDRLAETAGNGKSWIHLPAGACFGAVTIDSRTCTLCMACVSACPSGALAAGGDVPRIRFVESRCHQCGFCRETCPEHAVQLVPRMMLDAKQVEAPVVLSEEEVFRCVNCGVPFAPKKMVNRMTEKLKEHWMYANERQQLRLKMCRLCRTRDTLLSEDMRLWNR